MHKYLAEKFIKASSFIIILMISIDYFISQVLVFSCVAMNKSYFPWQLQALRLLQRNILGSIYGFILFRRRGDSPWIAHTATPTAYI